MKGHLLLIVAVLLVGCEYAAYWVLVPPRPSADERWDLELPGGSFANVVGQNQPWQLGYTAALVGAVYAAKTAIVFRCPSPRTAIAWYAVVAMACLPMMWVFVTTDWNNAHAELAYWFTDPVGLLAVPTIGFALDLMERPYRSRRTYVIKTAVEVVFIPVAFVAWVFAEVFVLGFYWI